MKIEKHGEKKKTDLDKVEYFKKRKRKEGSNNKTKNEMNHE